MSLAMSFTMTAAFGGFGRGFITKWMTGFLIGFAVSLPISVLVMPQLRKFIDSITDVNEPARNTMNGT